jgi:hypothetical protein
MKKCTLILLLYVAINAYTFNDIEDTVLNELGKTKHLLRDGYRQVERLNQNWHDNISQWINDEKYITEYSTDNEDYIVYREYWSSGGWFIHNRTAFTLIENLLTEILIENYDTNEWINEHLQTHTYNDDGNLTSLIMSNWEEEQWIETHRMFLIYENANCMQKTYATIFSETDIDSIRYSYTYDNMGNLLSEIRDSKTDGGWLSEEKKEYYYDGYLLSYYEYFLYESDIWLLDKKISYLYDDDENTTEILNQGWIAEEWINRYKQTFYYDENNNETFIQYEQFQDMEWEFYHTILNMYDENQNLTSQIREDWENGFSFYNDRTLFTYEEYTDVAEETIDNSPCLYSLSNSPNPFNPSTTISFTLSAEQKEDTKVVIYNTKGQRVDTLPISFDSAQDDSVIWNADRFASGVYFYKLVADGKAVATKKMLLLK